MTAPHQPYKQPFNDAVGKFVCRCDCGCGLFVEAQTEQEADALVAAAEEVTPDVD